MYLFFNDEVLMHVFNPKFCWHGESEVNSNKHWEPSSSHLTFWRWKFRWWVNEWMDKGEGWKYHKYFGIHDICALRSKTYASPVYFCRCGPADWCNRLSLVLPILMNAKAALESGSVLVILNPAPVLQALHSVPNRAWTCNHSRMVLIYSCP